MGSRCRYCHPEQRSAVLPISKVPLSSTGLELRNCHSSLLELFDDRFSHLGQRSRRKISKMAERFRAFLTRSASPIVQTMEIGRGTECERRERGASRPEIAAASGHRGRSTIFGEIVYNESAAARSASRLPCGARPPQ